MNKVLLRIGGAVNLLFALFQLSLVKPMGEALHSMPPDLQGTISTLNISLAFVLLIFGCLAIFCWRDLLTTRLGNITAVAIALFWFLRGINQVIFYEVSVADLPLIGLCIAFGLLHLIPVLRQWKDRRNPAQGPASQQSDGMSRVQEWIGRTRWASYAAVAWCVLFGGMHLYWALGGTAGFAEFSMPSNRMLALTRDPLYMGITWGVVIACAFAAMLALAPFQAWSRRIPLWLLLTPLWIVFALFLVRGVGTTIQSAVMIAGGLPFEPLSGPEAQAWSVYLVRDAVLWSPWFTLGGLAFGATAWAARWQSNHRGGPQRMKLAQS